LGLRQVVMVLMNWAIDVPRQLLQSDAKFDLIFLFSFNRNIEEINLISLLCARCCSGGRRS